MIRVLIVDDHPIVREGLKLLLDGASGIVAAGEAANGDDALKKLHKEKFDVMLLDISMPKKNGVDTLRQIISEKNGIKVLILSMHQEDQYAVRLMKAGASGYLTKGAAPQQLIDAIRNVINGKKYISKELSRLLRQDFNADSDAPSHELLSDREYQVLRLIGMGKQLTEIAESLSLSIKTISTYRTQILEKMKLKNNAELISYVINNALGEFEPEK